MAESKAVNSGRDIPVGIDPDGRWGDLLSGRNLIYSLTLGGGVILHALNIFI